MPLIFFAMLMPLLAIAAAICHCCRFIAIFAAYGYFSAIIYARFCAYATAFSIFRRVFSLFFFFH